MCMRLGDTFQLEDVLPEGEFEAEFPIIVGERTCLVGQGIDKTVLRQRKAGN